MSHARRFAAVLVALLAAASLRAEPTKPGWEYSAAAYWYVLSDESDYVLPVFTADREHLHLEARYNYEDFETGSMWAGYNFHFGSSVEVELTPMMGFAFGNTKGPAPGYRFTLDWRWLEVYSEAEWVYDLRNSDDSFFYVWSELSAYPWDWLRVGLISQRTHIVDTPHWVDRGLFVGYDFRDMEVAVYALNPDESDRFFMLAFSIEFGAGEPGSGD